MQILVNTDNTLTRRPTCGATDMRCTREARPAGKLPIAVSHSATTTEQTCTGAVKKLRSVVGALGYRLMGGCPFPHL